MSTMTQTPIMTVGELASYLRLHEQTVYKMAKEGRVPAFKVGNRWRFREGDIREWLQAQQFGRPDSSADTAGVTTL